MRRWWRLVWRHCVAFCRLPNFQIKDARSIDELQLAETVNVIQSKAIKWQKHVKVMEIRLWWPHDSASQRRMAAGFAPRFTQASTRWYDPSFGHTESTQKKIKIHLPAGNNHPQLTDNLLPGIPDIYDPASFFHAPLPRTNENWGILQMRRWHTTLPHGENWKKQNFLKIARFVRKFRHCHPPNILFH